MLSFLNHFGPIFFRFFKECVAVHIIHEHDSYYCSQSRETPRSFYTFLYDHQKEIGYQGDPNLYLDGVGALSIEVFKWEVLFQLLEQQLNFPSFAVYCYNVFHLHGHVVGEQRYDFRLFLREVNVSDNAGLVFDILPVLYMLLELYTLNSVFMECIASGSWHGHPTWFRLRSGTRWLGKVALPKDGCGPRAGPPAGCRAA